MVINMRKRKLICLFSVLLLLGACSSNPKANIKKDKETSIHSGKDVKQIKSTIMHGFDFINEFDGLSNDEMLIVGEKNKQQVMGEFNFKTGEFSKSLHPIQYAREDGKIGILHSGFYMTSLDSVRIYNNKLELIKEITIPNKEDRAVPSINPVCLSKEGDKLYYTKMNTDFTSSLICRDVNTNQDTLICTYGQPGALSVITDMMVTNDDAIAFVGQTPPSAKEQSISSYGTIKLSDGKIDNHIVNHIQFKTGRDMIAITDAVDPTFTSKPKGYIYLMDGGLFVKEDVKGAKDVKLCGEHAFITHDTDINNHNVYSPFKTYIYDKGKVIKTYNESGKYQYGDYVTDFYNASYGLYFQTSYTRKGKFSLDVYNVYDKGE